MSDILIIGGGIAGISAAARLAPYAAVTLLEAEDHLGYHASGRSAAAYLDFYGNDIVRALNRAGAAHLHGDGVTTARGFLYLARPEEEAAFRAHVADTGFEEITFSEAQALVPILDPETCAYLASGKVFDIDTDLYIQNFRRTALSHGAKIITGAPVRELKRAYGRWRAETPQGGYGGDVVINAAGAWADEMAAMAGLGRIRLQPMRRSMARIPAPGGHDVAGWPMLDAVDDRWYAKPDAGCLIVSPGDEDPVDPQDAWADDMVLAEGLARYEAMVTEPVTRLRASWAGLRTFAPDRTLVIGQAPEAEGFFWLAGQGGYGFQTAAAASQLLADLVMERTPELSAEVVSALDPARFG